MADFVLEKAGHHTDSSMMNLKGYKMMMSTSLVWFKISKTTF